MEQRSKFEEMEKLSAEVEMSRAQVEVSRASLNAELSWKSEAMSIVARAERERRNVVAKINDLNETLDRRFFAIKVQFPHTWHLKIARKNLCSKNLRT